MDTESIKKAGETLGYSKVGVTSAEGFDDYIREVLSRGDKFDILSYTTTNPLKDAAVQEVMPEAKSIIVAAWDYFRKDYPAHLKEMIGKAYLGRCYNPQPGSPAYDSLHSLIEYLEQKGCKVRTDIGIPARFAAAKAGIAAFGKNNFAYTDESGSYIIITTLVIDRELEYDKPAMGCKCPADCRICMDACPTHAIYEPFKLDPKKCLAYNHWMTQEGRKGISSNIPQEIRKVMGCKIHGCDICQDVCPRNQKKLKETKEMDDYIEELGEAIDLPAILNMTDDFYEDNIRPIMYNYIKDPRYFRRNAAIAMGNSGDRSYIPHLENALKSSDEMIRDSARWALERLCSL